MTKPLTSTIATLSRCDDVIIIDLDEQADLHALFLAHEGESINGRRLQRIGVSDDGRDALWHFVAEDLKPS